MFCFCCLCIVGFVAYRSSDFLAATMTKIIKEMLPPDVRVARDAQDLLIECCVGQNLTTHDSFICVVTRIAVAQN